MAVPPIPDADTPFPDEFPPPSAAAGVVGTPMPRFRLSKEAVALVPGRKRRTVRIINTGDRPIQVGSHYHFFEANRALAFDRAATFGMRLDIPAGTSVRFEPGDERDVQVVEIGGMRRPMGFASLVDGSASATGAPSLGREALECARARGFLDTPEGGSPESSR